jgi:hypothetical protein
LFGLRFPSAGSFAGCPARNFTGWPRGSLTGCSGKVKRGIGTKVFQRNFLQNRGCGFPREVILLLFPLRRSSKLGLRAHRTLWCHQIRYISQIVIRPVFLGDHRPYGDTIILVLNGNIHPGAGIAVQEQAIFLRVCKEFREKLMN